MTRNVNPKLWKAAIEASESHIMRTYRELEELWKHGRIRIPGLALPKAKPCKDPSRCSCEACSHAHGRPAKRKPRRVCKNGKCRVKR